MSYTSIEPLLGIKNFRKEFRTAVKTLSQFSPIDTATESLSDVNTFNTRFNKLSLAMRHCFNAAGDIAIRDKRYIETFLTGYTNPIVSQHYKYDATQLTSFINFPSFDFNGANITFPEDRVMYNVSYLGELNNTSTYTWVFKNGLLLDETDFDLVNTAYGVKCFVKSSLVSANDEIDVVVNRIYNTSKDAATKAITTTTTSTSFLVPVNQLGTFYNDKYIRLFVQRGTDIHRSFFDIPRAKYTTELDTTGTILKVDILDFQLNAGEIIHITNAVYFWEYHRVGETSVGFDPDIEITELQSNGLYRPVPHMSIEDFDVFFNGYHLTPGKHFTIIKGSNEFSPYKIRLMFLPPENSPHSLHIFKNEAVSEDSDFILIRANEISDKGVVVTQAATTLPLMPRLGHCFMSDKYVSNSKLSTKNRRVLCVSDVTTKQYMDYKVKVITSYDIAQVMDFVNDNLSEYDLLAEWIDIISNEVGITGVQGLAELAQIALTIDPLNLSFQDANVTGWIHTDTLTIAVEQFRAIAEAYLADQLDRTLAIDANILTTEPYPMNIVDDLLVLDSNMQQTEVFVLDSNVLFVN